MKKAIVSLSFDDARADNVDVFEKILFPRDIPATLNVTTGYVDGSCPEEDSPTFLPAMTIDDVVKLYHSGRVEIALHGDRHKNTEQDIASGREKLIQWLSLPIDHVFGLASPGSGMSLDDFINSGSILFQEQIQYLRTSLRIQSAEPIRVLFRKAGRVWHLPLFYRIAYRDTIMQSCDDRIIYSVPVMSDIFLNQVKAIVDEAVKVQGGLTLMFHSIGIDSPQEDHWTWRTDRFSELCNYIVSLRDAQKLDIMTSKELFEHLKV